MCRSTPIVLIAACLSLLGVQVSGLHVHIGAEGFDASPHTRHIHGARPSPAADTDLEHGLHSHGAEHHEHPVRDAADDDHAGDRDVYVDLGAGTSKLLILFLWIALGLLVLLPPMAQSIRPSDIVQRPKQRYERWRPPLRAPPPFSH
jgi:hypothetical protein